MSRSSDFADEIARFRLTRRTFLNRLAATAALTALPSAARLAYAADKRHDLIVVGAGNAGLPAAIFAAQRGARVLILDAADVAGGTLLISFGQMSAAGTKVQAAKGIKDSPERHFEDIMRISQGTADPDLVRLAVWNAGPTFDWLMDHGFKMRPEHPVLGEAHEPYSIPRYYWGEQFGFSIVEVLMQELQPLIDKGRVELLLSTRVTELLTGNRGEIVGVRARSGDREVTFMGRNTLLACGGYASNAELFEQLCGHKKYGDASYPYAQGEGIKLALAVGGFVRGRDKYLSNFGAIMETTDVPSKPIARFNSYPERRQPWEIYVNVRGERFVREDEPSVDAREHALLKQPDLRYWIVFDKAILEQAPVGVFGWTREQLVSKFGEHPSFLKADTLEGLAEAAGIDVRGMLATVEKYNGAVERGSDELGRKHLPRKIAEPPFYAIRLQGYSVTSTVGLAVDHDLRLMRKDGSSVPNLYIAGELIGTGQLMGQSFCGGMMVTPALTFGRLIGLRLPKA